MNPNGIAFYDRCFKKVRSRLMYRSRILLFKLLLCYPPILSTLLPVANMRIYSVLLPCGQ